MKTLDDIRTKYPHLGLGLYALDPRGTVTLECVSSDGKLFSFTGQTEAEAVAAAFPEEEEPAAPTPSAIPTPTSVFD